MFIFKRWINRKDNLMLITNLTFDSIHDNQKEFNGVLRFKVSPLTSTMTRMKAMDSKIFNNFGNDIKEIDESPKYNTQYILSTSVANSPIDWCGPDKFNNGYDRNFPNKKNLFSIIKDKDIDDLRSNRAFLLLDQSHEGYQTLWLWEWFHNNCDDYGIDPNRIIYVTGNLDSDDQYTEWANLHQIVNRIKVIPYPHFELMIYDTADNYNCYTKTIINIFQKQKLPTLSDQLDYKNNNLKNIKMFNALQKRARAHRIWFFKYLYENMLLDTNIVSMNSFEFHKTYYEGRNIDKEMFDKLEKITPIFPPQTAKKTKMDEFIDSDCGEYLTELNEQIMLDSWLTVVSEASFGDLENTCFISEKTFKPIFCYHPFIIFGNRGSLKRLREMGYKTFSPFINEEYDELPTWERMDAITKELIRLSSMDDTERLNWYTSMSDILTYNFEILFRNSRMKVPPAMIELKKYIGKTDV